MYSRQGCSSSNSNLISLRYSRSWRISVCASAFFDWWEFRVSDKRDLSFLKNVAQRFPPDILVGAGEVPYRGIVPVDACWIKIPAMLGGGKQLIADLWTHLMFLRWSYKYVTVLSTVVSEDHLSIDFWRNYWRCEEARRSPSYSKMDDYMYGRVSSPKHSSKP